MLLPGIMVDFLSVEKKYHRFTVSDPSGFVYTDSIVNRDSKSDAFIQ